MADNEDGDFDSSKTTIVAPVDDSLIFKNIEQFTTVSYHVGKPEVFLITFSCRHLSRPHLRLILQAFWTST